MTGRKIRKETIEQYCAWLQEEERSAGTIEKYRYYLNTFYAFMAGKEVCKGAVLAWKEALRRELSPVTVNGALAAVNGFFKYMDWSDCAVRFIKVKRRVFCAESGELSKDDYTKLVRQAQADGNERLALLIQTICATGIRVSELRYITVESLKRRAAEVDCKGKVRVVLLTDRLCGLLKAYAQRQKIASGMIFVTRTGKPVDRSNIWREMKLAGRRAGVEPEKVFPHNLRHLFARAYYSQEKDLLRLADILGHSSVNTTRIYTMESGKSRLKQIESLDLLIGSYNKISLLL